jgi:hypothetical protein
MVRRMLASAHMSKNVGVVIVFSAGLALACAAFLEWIEHTRFVVSLLGL